MIDNEEQKNNSIQGKPKKKASLLLPIIVAAVIFVLLITTILLNQNIYPKIEDTNLETCYQIDSVSVSENEIQIEGWFFKVDCDVDQSNCDSLRVVLVDCNDSSKKYYLDTTYGIVREDVNSYYLCQYDYTNCGFTGTADLSTVDLYGQDFIICIQYNKAIDDYIDTKTYLHEGQMVFEDPTKSLAPDLSGTDFERIAKEGYPRVLRPDIGMYVYQYGGNLYWFADENYEFDQSGQTFIQFQLWTTQPTYLPEERIVQGCSWDNRSFFFEKYEVTGQYNTGNYRLAVRAIPDFYSITTILTGFYRDGDYVWQDSFRIRLDF